MHMARIVRFHQTGSPDVLQLEEVEIPPPGPGEVRIRVKALGLNRAEALFRSGRYLETPRLPARLGYEAAGTVEAVGQGVQGFRAGDVVSTIPAFSQNQYGVYGEVATVPATALAKHPSSLSWIEAAAIWMQYFTAYGALIDLGHLEKGETVLVSAASSSVGIAAIQIARMVGATPIALTRGASKRQALLDAGAGAVIVTSEQDVVEEVGRVTGGKGARVVFDPVGGPGIVNLAAAMSERGTLFLYGALSTEPTPFPPALLRRSLTIRGFMLFEVTADPTRLAAGKEFIVGGLSSGKLKATVARTFSLDQIVEAHRYLESNQQVGKIVVTV
jgi:NADPH:quinone reductase-like Zn-dependent oxidoreductase